MGAGLAVSIGQFSDKGVKAINQDFHGALVPQEPERSMKGIAVAIADGISSSAVSHIAAETAVKSFLTDYYCTSEAWTVKLAAERVISATNAWLYSQSRQSQHAHDQDKGYVTTFTVVVFKAASAHIFHIGDTRVYRVSGRSLEQLTVDHRTVVSSSQAYLARAMGVNPDVEIDCRVERLVPGDVYILASDGVYEFVDGKLIADAVAANDNNLDAAAERIVEAALANGSSDNLTVQVVRLDHVPASGDAADLASEAVRLPLPPVLAPRADFDGYTILRSLYASSRSHVYLAEDRESGARVVIKVPSIDMVSDEGHMRRFMMEDWIARRINSAHVLKAYARTRPPNYLYTVTEFIEGRSLTQWMIDNPRPTLDQVRDITAQIIKGLRAFHRMEMVHQDLRPENILIDNASTVKIIDFGSTRVAGVVEANPLGDDGDILGTLQFTAPEHFYGETGTERADFFSLGVIVYHMLTGKLPYGASVSKIRTRQQARKLRYHSASLYNESVPDWIDGALKRAVHPDPWKRYQALSEFEFDLKNPNPAFLGQGAQVSFVERHPLIVWQMLTLFFAALSFALALRLYS
ncbi:bifunctional protein-serine/threonine kinase/phosphatase [Rhizobium sp. L1K21]|uniref:bifunctional protein-serine/threonine kinase/phosphatase n=1 Tax=Rhizobium sp. L1K21 TaxID=2954933 RepID=UPI0020931751|nr:bifunctional protein-serine/threonine kinase/phosphatase [Rhizobium sp. L1K21]MCO6185292.1 protein kinase [Rhizobium sp. L1K21]